MAGKPWNMGEVRDAVAMRERGLTYKEIGSLLNRNYESVRRHVCPYLAPKKYIRCDPEKIRSLASAGLSQREMARELGADRKSVRAWCRRLGLSLPRGSLPVRSREYREKMEDANLRRYARDAADLGWPGLDRPAQARLLNDILSGISSRQDLLASGWNRRHLNRVSRELLLLDYLTRHVHNKRVSYTLTTRVLYLREQAGRSQLREQAG